jgi:hypothetical protein
MLAEITGHTVKGRGYGNLDTTRVRINYPAGRTRKVMILGRSSRFAGEVKGYEEDGRWLQVVESHPVWMVQPLHGQRYRKPLAVLRDQIILGGCWGEEKGT